MRVRYEPMRHRVAGVFEVWLLDGTPGPWLLGWIRDAEGTWIARSRTDGEPVGGFPRRRDAAAFLAIVGGWCKRGRRVALAAALALVLSGTARAETPPLPSFQKGICTGLRDAVASTLKRNCRTIGSAASLGKHRLSLTADHQCELGAHNMTIGTLARIARSVCGDVPKMLTRKDDEPERGPRQAAAGGAESPSTARPAARGDMNPCRG